MESEPRPREDAGVRKDVLIVRSIRVLSIVMLVVAPAYADLFVQTIGDVDGMVDATFTTLDAEYNMDTFVFSPNSNPPYASHPQVNEDGSMQWSMAFDPGTSVDAIDGATLEIAAWDVDWDDGEVVTIGNDTVSYVLGGMNNVNQGYTSIFVDGVTTGSGTYGTLVPQLTSYTLTSEQASDLFLDGSPVWVRVDVETYHRALAVDYSIVSINYTPGAAPVHTPEPATMLMLGALGAGLAGARRLRRTK
jgi:hypothetical protein